MKKFLVKFVIKGKRYGEYVIAKNGFDALITAAQNNQLPCVAGTAICMRGAV